MAPCIISLLLEKLESTILTTVYTLSDPPPLLSLKKDYHALDYEIAAFAKRYPC
jgi:hypothetical protein